MKHYRIPLQDLPFMEQIRFTDFHKADDKLIDALKDIDPSLDMRWDRFSNKMCLFQIHPRTCLLLDIASYDLSRVGMWIVDVMSPVLESPAEFVKRNRDKRMLEDMKKDEDIKEMITRRVNEDWNIWDDYFEAMNSKGNVFKRHDHKKPWMEFILPTQGNYKPQISFQHNKYNN